MTANGKSKLHDDCQRAAIRGAMADVCADCLPRAVELGHLPNPDADDPRPSNCKPKAGSIAYRTQNNIDASRADGKGTFAAFDAAMTAEVDALTNRLPILTAGELLDKYTAMRPSIIEGLLRVGETMNVISAPKVGKSWLVTGLSFAIATGQPWLGMFPTMQGKVLVLDNELHPETIAQRLRRMADACNIPLAMIRDTVHIVSLRGRLKDLLRIGQAMELIEAGTYRLVIVDAFYRTLPMDTDENSNGQMANLYNLIDQHADTLGSAFALIHHASKGSQSDKSVTDVGSGAGSQSRAVDTHLVLRPHKEDNIFVLDAAVRSWPPVAPRCLKWTFPLWEMAADKDPTALRRPGRRQKSGDAAAPLKPTATPWDGKRFASEFGKPEPRQRDAILDDARAQLSDTKAEKLLKAAIACGHLHAWKTDGANSATMVSTKPRPAKKRGRPKKTIKK